MYERFSEWVVFALTIYTGLGFLSALAFVSVGVTKMDPEAKGTKIGFRLIIIPGVMIFWPLLLQRWTRGVTEPPAERNPHR